MANTQQILDQIQEVLDDEGLQDVEKLDIILDIVKEA